MVAAMPAQSICYVSASLVEVFIIKSADLENDNELSINNLILKG
jgi:hypothetical protein